MSDGTRSRPALTMMLLGTVAGAASFGDAAAIVTLILRLYQAGHRAWAITALLFAILGPSALVAPFASRILSWAGRWRSLMLISAGQGAAAIGLVFVTAAVPTLLLVVLLGAGLALTQPALLEITPLVIGSDQLVWANSITKSADWTGWTVGPLAGGALCAIGWATAALGIEAASFVIAGACFAALSLVRTGTSSEPVVLGARGGLRAALGDLRRDRELARLVAAAGIANVGVSMIAVAEVFFARAVLGAGSIGFASLSSAWFAGMVTGTLLAPKADSWRRAGIAPAGIAPAGIGLAGVAIVVAAAAGNLPVALLCYGAAGIGFGLQATLMRSLIQRRATGVAGPAAGGSVIGIYVAVDMSTQLAGYLAGGAVLLAGARFTLLVAGAGLCSASCLAIALARMEVHLEQQPERDTRRDALEGTRIPVTADRPAAQRVPGAEPAGP